MALLDNVASDFVPVTPSNTNKLPNGMCAALWIGGVGTIQVTTESGNVRQITVGNPDPVPLKCSQVWVDNTTATNIMAIYV